MKKEFIILCILALLAGCQFSRSVKKDFLSGITSTGKNISCEDVYVTVNNEKKSGNTFIYGETFVINFSNVTGLVKTGDKVFPEMVMAVVNSTGDTLFRTGDLTSGYPDGISLSPLTLTANLTVAAPIKSKGEYKLTVNISDKKGDGTFVADYKFKVIENDKITIESNGASYDEVYLFSEGSSSVITDNKVNFDDNTYIIIEGLKGFNETDGMVFPGLSIKAMDAAKTAVLESDDLFAGYTLTGLAAADVSRRVSAHFTIPKTELKNPLKCEMTVWDKKGNAKIKVTTELILE
ncbi:MAG: hypothetical protein ACUVTX_07205 [Bacteroidales bacterium]